MSRYLAPLLLLLAGWSALSHSVLSDLRSREENPSFAQLMTDSMTRMSSAASAMPMPADPDADFAAMMILHHQGAIEMAQAQLLYGHNPILRRLAQEIVVTQGQEIAVLQGELTKANELCQTKP